MIIIFDQLELAPQACRESKRDAKSTDLDTKARLIESVRVRELLLVRLSASFKWRFSIEVVVVTVAGKCGGCWGIIRRGCKTLARTNTAACRQCKSTVGSVSTSVRACSVRACSARPSDLECRRDLHPGRHFRPFLPRNNRCNHRELKTYICKARHFMIFQMFF